VVREWFAVCKRAAKVHAAPNSSVASLVHALESLESWPTMPRDVDSQAVGQFNLEGGAWNGAANAPVSGIAP